MIYFRSARTSWSFAEAKRELENENWGLLPCSQVPPQVLIVCSSNALIAYGNCGSWLHTQIATHTPVGCDTCPATSKLQQIATSKLESAK